MPCTNERPCLQPVLRWTHSQACQKATERKFYVTTFCNFAHWLDNGRPIGHECYVLPPKDLGRERDAKDGDDLSDLYTKKGPIVIGRPLKGD